MLIEKVQTHLLQLPLSRPVLSADKPEHLAILIVQLLTKDGPEGLGFSWSHGAGGKALLALAEDDLTPQVVGEDAVDHVRISAKIAHHLGELPATSLVGRAWAAFDIALWDLRAKNANLPLHKYLGGARTSVPAYGADVGWRWMSPKQVVESAQPYLNKGMNGVKVHVGRVDPEEDAHRLTYIREALGEDGWLGVDADRRYDFATALLMGEFLEENGMDWFEEPIDAADLTGLGRLAAKTQVPLALGQSVATVSEFIPFLERGLGDVIQPSIMGLGGITNWLKAANLAEVHHRHIVPSGVPEIAVQLGCGVQGVRMIPHSEWLAPLFTEPLRIEKGQVVPPTGNGLGLTLRSEALEQFKA
jgi:L-alanine-DL-glutamate epimerase-like enolase superfamily enzyme